MKKKNKILKTILLFPIRVIWFFLKVGSLSAVLVGIWIVLQIYGILPVKVPVSGASMLPTLPERGYVDFQRYIADSKIRKYLPINIHRDDIVVFENQKTFEELHKQKKEGAGFVKRVIGLPGDKVEIRDGFVYVNGLLQKEQYTLKARSTFGGNFIHDCQEITVPKNQLFVLGDNRKVSMDSRQIGLIKFDDIKYFIPYDKQKELFTSRWRDSNQDLESENRSFFDVQKYLELLNKERKRHGLGDLVYQKKLEQSARLRAENMLRYNDFSFDAKKSGYIMRKAVADVGYSNVVYGEFPITGYYDAQELFDAFFEQKSSREFLLNPEYDDIGVSTFIGALNGCPAQVVVQHLAGFVPPNYTQEEIQSYKNAVERLRQIQPGWQKLKEFDTVYNKSKSDIDRINEIISMRISRFDAISLQMDSNLWLTDEQKKWIDEDVGLGKEQAEISERLNSSN